MQAIQLPQVVEALQNLSGEKLRFVYDLVQFLTEQGGKRKRKKAPVVVISAAEYEELQKLKRLTTFHAFARELGRDVEERGLTEEELMADLEITKRQVFEEYYGQVR